MAFDLYITFSGLCLLARRKEEMLVLLPRTDGCHKHWAVLGSDVRYQPDRTGEAVNGFVEHRLAEQQILLDLDTEHALDNHLHGFDIAEIPRTAGLLRPDLSYLQFVLVDGAPCPLGLCNQEKGAKWEYRGKRQNLATELHWRIRDVTSDADGAEGLSVRVATTDSRKYDVVLRPVNRQIRMYLFHTIADELPSNNPPAPNLLEPDSEAPHFCHYYDLFMGGAECDPPRFAPERVKSNRREKGEALFRHAHIGRRYSCVAATFNDTSDA